MQNEQEACKEHSVSSVEMKNGVSEDNKGDDPLPTNKDVGLSTKRNEFLFMIVSCVLYWGIHFQTW